MSTIDITTAAKTENSPAEPSRLQQAWDRIEQWLVRVGDRLNPILVKETRQAIKSRQFTITFVLVLLACWVVTIGGVAMIGPGIFYSASGPDMFWYYYWILSFPLAVIVPYSAYRSLAAEREDNTYELLSISNLTPRQIIAGKLGSALLQMLVFLSATAPCLAFTYLLRGIDVLTIAVLLTYTVLGSLGLSVIGLFMATSAKERYGQVILSVALVVGQVIVFFLSVGGSYEFIRWSYQFVSDTWFWIANLGILTAYLTTFALIFLAAAAQITFTSDNRSTPLRIAMVVQQACFIGWVCAMFMLAVAENPSIGNPPPVAIAMVLAIPSGIYWYAMGTMLTAEWPHLSARVKRSLPQSFLGRTFLTWFNPGPGTGYMFAIANLSAIAISGMFVLAAFPPSTVAGGPSEWDMFCFLLIGLGYIAAYLGLGKLVVDLLRRVAAVPMVASVLINGFLLAAGCGIPMVIHMMSNLRYSGYSLLHITNPIWTLEQILFGGNAYIDELVVIVPCVGLVMFALNLPSVLREIRQVRVAAPQRILEDDALLQPPRPPQRESPWDEPTDSSPLQRAD